MSQPRVLFVEDDADIRETLSDLLRDEGYDVSEAQSAHEGLDLLAEQHYDVLLSDYRLPDQNGTEMIAEAARRGALAGTAVLILSASTRIDGADGIRVLQKPIELELLCREIEAAAPLQPRAQGGAGARFVLFVIRPSVAAERAERTLHTLLARYGIDERCLEIVDVGTAEGSARASEERVAFTPALLRLSPQPRRWIVGDLRRKSVVERLLRESGANKG